MEFSVEKCTILIIRSGKGQMTEGIEVPNQEKMKMLGEKENYKYFGELEVDTIKQVMKEKIKRERFRKTGKLFETEVYTTKFIKMINTWAISRY